MFFSETLYVDFLQFWAVLGVQSGGHGAQVPRGEDEDEVGRDPHDDGVVGDEEGDEAGQEGVVGDEGGDKLVRAHRVLGEEIVDVDGGGRVVGEVDHRDA